MAIVWSRDACQQIEAALEERFEDVLEPGERVHVEGLDHEDAVSVRVLIEGGASGMRLDLTAEAPLSKTLPLAAAKDLALDALDLVLQSFFDSGRSERFAGVFESRELRGHAVRIRAERTFPSLEAQADALLKGAGDEDLPN